MDSGVHAKAAFIFSYDLPKERCFKARSIHPRGIHNFNKRNSRALTGLSPV
jgi:hypothetical protein